MNKYIIWDRNVTPGVKLATIDAANRAHALRIYMRDAHLSMDYCQIIQGGKGHTRYYYITSLFGHFLEARKL